MATVTNYQVAKEAHSGTPSLVAPFVVRIMVDFGKHNAGSANTSFIGPELEEGTFPISCHVNPIVTGDGTVSISAGYTDDGTEWVSAATVTTTATYTDAIALASTQIRVPAQSGATKQYLRVTTDDSAENNAKFELIFVCIKALEFAQSK